MPLVLSLISFVWNPTFEWNNAKLSSQLYCLFKSEFCWVHPVPKYASFHPLYIWKNLNEGFDVDGIRDFWKISIYHDFASGKGLSAHLLRRWTYITPHLLEHPAHYYRFFIIFCTSIGGSAWTSASLVLLTSCFL